MEHLSRVGARVRVRSLEDPDEEAEEREAWVSLLRVTHPDPTLNKQQMMGKKTIQTIYYKSMIDR